MTPQENRAERQPGCSSAGSACSGRAIVGTQRSSDEAQKAIPAAPPKCLGCAPGEGATQSSAPAPLGLEITERESRRDVNRPFQFNTNASEKKMEKSTKTDNILRDGNCDLSLEP